ncbi:MAG: hypothetical protein LBT79_03920 [Elusimicrobiota bacterium]|jgi:adenosine deaminase|nr:hypothetical protein [Elusimicrobiota bacterium]
MKKMKCLLFVAVILSFTLTAFAAKIDNYFEYAKKNEALITAFLHKMPKGADLDNNASISKYGESIVDYAINNNLVFDRFSQSFTTATKNSSWTASDLAYNAKAYNEVLKLLSIKGYSAFNKIANSADYYDAVREVLALSVEQNILYIELFANAEEEDISQMTDKIENIRKDVSSQTKKNIEVGILLTIDENTFPSGKTPFDEKEYVPYFAAQVAKIMNAAVKYRSTAIVGVSLLQNEDGWLAQKAFNAQIGVIHRYWQAYQSRGAAINMSVPAGALTLQYAPYESLIDHISKSVRFGHAKRIINGTSAAWESDIYSLLGYMRSNKIAVEISPSKDESILNARGANHPFVLYKDAGVPIIIYSGEQGFLRSNLTREYAKAAVDFNLTYQDIKRLSFNALEYSFIAGESLFEDENYAKIKKVVPTNSKKAALQKQLLDAFNEFEKSMEDIIKNDFPNVK